MKMAVFDFALRKKGVIWCVTYHYTIVVAVLGYQYLHRYI